MHFEVLLSGPSRCYYLGQVDCNLEMANLAQIITPQNCARNFFQKKKCWNPKFYSVFDKQCFVNKANLAQIITPQKAKLGPDNNTTAYIYRFREKISLRSVGWCLQTQHFFNFPLGPSPRQNGMCIRRPRTQERGPVSAVKNAPTCYIARAGRNSEFSRKNTEKIPPGPKFWNPKKYQKKNKTGILGIFGVFSGIFGVFWG